MCFSVTPLNSVTSLDLTNSPIQLSKDRNLKVFIHEPGDEFWIIRAIFPIHIDVISIEGVRISSNEAKSLIGLISHYKLIWVAGCVNVEISIAEIYWSDH